MWTFLIGVLIGFLLSVSMFSIQAFRLFKIIAVLKHTSVWKKWMDRFDDAYVIMNKTIPNEVNEIANQISNTKFKI